jgi:TatD DNase family protein
MLEMNAETMNPFLIDTHVHLCAPSFAEDIRDVLVRARQSGVGAVIAVTETMEEAVRNMELARQYPGVLPAAGLYPEYADLALAHEMQEFIRRESGNLWAIGEVGLDFRLAQTEEDKELQREVFTGFIHLSRELDLPVNVHSRSAGRQAIELLCDLGADKVQMHAFDGKAGSAGTAVEAGYFFSVPPSVVRSRQKQKLLKQLPLSCLLLETDAPVLGPDPKERNEPSNLLVSLKAIAEIKNIPEQEVREAVFENTRCLYGQVPLSSVHLGL